MQSLATEGTSEVATSPVEFDDFYRDEYVPLLRLGYVLGGSRAAAEELVQDTMLRAYRHWSKVRNYDKPGAWARRVLVNLATSRRRKLTAEARAMVRVRHRDAHAELEPDSEELWRELRKLPARQAQALALFYVEDRSISDIAALLECAEGTVKALLHRGRNALALALDTVEEDTP
jgi:RNA polymerase sigma-70 factor, ECF subfamily